MATVRVDGASLEVVEQGSGDPLVFVHGSASDLRTWDGQLEAFRNAYRGIAYSRRYHWPNEKIPSGESYALEEQVADLAALLRALGAAPAHLVGHSYGGLVCLLLAARAPELVRSLVLAEPPVVTLFVSMSPRPAEILKLALRSPGTAAGIVKLGALGLGPAAAAFERGDREGAMRSMGTGILGPEAFRSLSDARRAQVRDNLIEEELRSPESMPRLERDVVRSLRCPVLLVGGTRSPRVFRHLLDQLERMLPASERVAIPGASHLMHEDDPAAFAGALLAFLRRHSAGASSGSRASA